MSFVCTICKFTNSASNVCCDVCHASLSKKRSADSAVVTRSRSRSLSPVRKRRTALTTAANSPPTAAPLLVPADVAVALKALAATFKPTDRVADLRDPEELIDRGHAILVRLLASSRTRVLASSVEAAGALFAIAATRLVQQQRGASTPFFRALLFIGICARHAQNAPLRAQSGMERGLAFQSFRGLVETEEMQLREGLVVSGRRLPSGVAQTVYVRPSDSHSFALVRHAFVCGFDALLADRDVLLREMAWYVARAQRWSATWVATLTAIAPFASGDRKHRYAWRWTNKSGKLAVVISFNTERDAEWRVVKLGASSSSSASTTLPPLPLPSPSPTRSRR